MRSFSDLKIAPQIEEQVVRSKCWPEPHYTHSSCEFAQLSSQLSSSHSYLSMFRAYPKPLDAVDSVVKLSDWRQGTLMAKVRLCETIYRSVWTRCSWQCLVRFFSGTKVPDYSSFLSTAYLTTSNFGLRIIFFGNEGSVIPSGGLIGHAHRQELLLQISKNKSQVRSACPTSLVFSVLQTLTSAVQATIPIQTYINTDGEKKIRFFMTKLDLNKCLSTNPTLQKALEWKLEPKELICIHRNIDNE